MTEVADSKSEVSTPNPAALSSTTTTSVVEVVIVEEVKTEVSAPVSNDNECEAEPEKKKKPTKKTTKKLPVLKHAIQRRIANAEEALSGAYQNVKQRFKEAIAKRAGQDFWLSAQRRKQKRLFKQIHQQTFAQQQQQEDDNDDESADKPTTWSPDASVNRDLFTRNIAQAVRQQLVAYQTSSTSVRAKKLLFVKLGKPIHIFSLPFFTDATSSEDEQITWNEFKESVFYAYVDGLSQNIASVDAEIVVAKKVQVAFSELKSELPSNQEVTYGMLFQRLQSYNALPADDKFWKLSCWSDEHAQMFTNPELFSKKYGNKKSIADLEQLKQDLEEEQRVSFDPKQLHLTAPETAALADAEDDVEDEEQEQEQELLADDTSPEAEISVIEVSQVEKKRDTSKLVAAPEQKADDNDDDDNLPEISISRPSTLLRPLQSFAGFPSSLLDKYDVLPPLSRDIVRKLHSVLRKNPGQDSTDAARILFQTAVVEFQKEQDEVNIWAAQEQAKLDQGIAKTKKEDARHQLRANFDMTNQQIQLLLEQIRQQQVAILDTLRDNYRNELKALRKSMSGCRSSPALTDFALTKTAAGTDPSMLSRYYQNQTGDEKRLSKLVDYRPELHDAFAQTAAADGDTEAGYIYAVIALKEHQAYRNMRLTERLSVAFLKQAVVDYNPDADSRSVVDALEVLRTVGIPLASVYEKFLQRQDKDSAKTRARIKALAASFAIDNYLRVKDATQARFALDKYGVLLVTLPVYNKQSLEFWDASTAAPALNADRARSLCAPPPLGYHTLLIVGYNDATRRFLLKNSLGLDYGAFGSSSISADVLFGNPHHLVIVAIDSDNKVQRDPIVIKSVTATAIQLLNKQSPDPKKSSLFA